MIRTSPLISVIIPVYNAEKTLVKCIESVLMQDVTDFELILVDDGSKDSSGDICDRYAAKDSRVKVIHKKNGGVSSARNVALNIANGHWITCLDSDDFYGEHFFEGVQGRSEDLLINGIVFLEDNGEVENRIILEGASPKWSLTDFVSSYIHTPLLRGPITKFYRRQLVADLRFPEDMVVGEDSYFVFRYLARCKNFGILHSFYYYLIPPMPQQVKYGLTIEKAGVSLLHLMEAFKELEENLSIPRNRFLSFYSYFKMVSKDYWKRHPSRWLRNNNVMKSYKFIWQELPLTQKLRYKLLGF